MPGLSLVATLLEERRRQLRITYRDLSQLAGISQTQVYKLTHDQLRSAPNPEHLQRLAAVLDLDYAELLQAARDDVGARRFSANNVVVFSREELTDDDVDAVHSMVDHLRAKNRQQAAN